MRHRIGGKQLCRDGDHRRAMLRNLAAGLFEHGQIETTLPKAKAVQPFVEKIITIAKRNNLHARRQIEARINDRKIFAWLKDSSMSESKKRNSFFDLPDESAIELNRYGEVRKAPRLVEHIIKTVAPLYSDRDGGYTRIIKLGKNRLGDGTDLVLLQLVGQEDGPQLGSGTPRRREIGNRRAAFAARLRKSFAGDDAASEPSEEVAATATEEPSNEQAAVDATEVAVPEATGDDESKADSQEAAAEAPTDDSAGESGEAKSE